MKKHRNIPHSLEECTQTGETAAKLYQFASQLEKWGNRLLIILMIAGILFTIVNIIGLIDVNEALIIPTLISSVLSWSIYTAIAFFAYHLFAILIRALASITENTTITANVALWEASKKAMPAKELPKKPQSAPAADQPAAPAAPPPPVVYEDGSWSCPNCGQKNLSTRTTCWRCDHQK